jgi:hypothetical protein
VPSDNNSDGLGAYTNVVGALKNASADKMNLAVRNSLVGSASSTVFTQTPGGSPTGGGLIVFSIAGLGKAGTQMVRQSINDDNKSGAAPAPTFASATRKNSVIITGVFDGLQPPNLTIPSGFTLGNNEGYVLPQTGITTAYLNNGQVITAVTWGTSDSSSFCDLAVEFSVPTVPQVLLQSGYSAI